MDTPGTNDESGISVYVTFHEVSIAPSRLGRYWKMGDWFGIVKLYGVSAIRKMAVAWVGVGASRR